MKGKLNIEDLIRQFLEGKLTGAELYLLMTKFSKNEIPEELNEIFQYDWENASTIASEKHLRANLQNILDKIGTPFFDENPFDEKSNILNTSIWISLAKYAAVVLVTIGLSWFIFSNILKPSDKKNIHICTVNVAYGSKTKIELPDGTLVTLNSGSYIKYPNIFTDNQRTIYFEGEAFFEVSKNKSKPFIVKTPEIQIKVLGTSFNVKSYPEEKIVTTTLVSGKIEIYSNNRKNYKQKPIVLLPNQIIKIEKSYIQVVSEITNTDMGDDQLAESQKPVKLENIKRPELYTSWKDNVLEFNNEKFEDLIVKLERWYDVKISLINIDFNQVRLSGRFHKESIEQALDALKLMVPFQYEMDRNYIEVKKRDNK